MASIKTMETICNIALKVSDKFKCAHKLLSGVLSNKETPKIITLAITSFNVFILKIASLTHFQDKDNRKIIINKSVAAVPIATPIAGDIQLTLSATTFPNKIDNPTLRMVPLNIAMR